MKRQSINLLSMKRRGVMVLVSLVGLGSLAFAQSGAPALLQFHGRLVNPMTGQPITTPTPIRIQLIQGGTAEENPSTGRLVFSEQAEVRPDDNGEFDYAIGSNARGGRPSTILGAEDLNTTRPVFIETALVGPDGSVQVLLPRQRLVSVGYALQATDAAVDERLVNVEGDTMTGPLQIQASLQVGGGGPSLGIGDAFVAGTLQVGAMSVQINDAGIQFPDGTIQTTAGIAPNQVVRSLNGLMGNLTLAQGANITITPAGNMLTIAAPNALSSVAHNGTLTGNGTGGSPLGIADGGVGTNQLATNAVTAAKIAPGQVVKSLNGLFDNVTLQAGSNVTITPAGNMLTVAAPNALSSVAHNGTLTGNGTGGSPLGVAVPLELSGTIGPNDAVIEGNSSGSIGVRGTSIANTGVRGVSSNGFGVQGESTSSVGVQGNSFSFVGVRGQSDLGTGVVGSTGVVGGSVSGGVRGESPSGFGVEGDSISGPGLVARSMTGHLILAFGSNPADVEFRVENNGDVRADGTIVGGGADFAEMMEVEEANRQEAKSSEPGDVLIISPETGKLRKCQQPYCPLVAGVYSTKPGFLAGQGDEESPANKVPVAFMGQVPCKVTTENGPIQIGDLLVTSSTPGHAMKGTDRSLMLGAIVGKALEPLASGSGIIRVLVTLQ